MKVVKKEEEVVSGQNVTNAGVHVRLVRHGDEVTIGGIRVSCLFTPCHTTGHICYYVTQVSKDNN